MNLNHGNRWTPDDDNRICMLIHTHRIRDIAVELQRGVGAIHQRLKLLRATGQLKDQAIGGQNPNFTPEQDELIRDLLATKTRAEIGRALQCSAKQVNARVYHLKQTGFIAADAPSRSQRGHGYSIKAELRKRSQERAARRRELKQQLLREEAETLAIGGGQRKRRMTPESPPFQGEIKGGAMAGPGVSDQARVECHHQLDRIERALRDSAQAAALLGIWTRRLRNCHESEIDSRLRMTLNHLDSLRTELCKA